VTRLETRSADWGRDHQGAMERLAGSKNKRGARCSRLKPARRYQREGSSVEDVARHDCRRLIADRGYCDGRALQPRIVHHASGCQSHAVQSSFKMAALTVVNLLGACVTSRGFSDLDVAERAAMCNASDRGVLLGRSARAWVDADAVCAHGQQFVPSLGDIAWTSLSATADVVVAEDGTISEVVEVRTAVAYHLQKSLNQCVASSLLGKQIFARLRARTRLTIFIQLDPPGVPIQVDGCPAAALPRARDAVSPMHG
jgi:hypothetical protein